MGYKEDREYEERAVAEIKRWAVTQSHGVRRAMMKIASLFDGGVAVDDVDHGDGPAGGISPRTTYINIPVSRNGKPLGYAVMIVSADELGCVHVSSSFDEIEEER